jgi:hypothetical protein
MIKPRVPGARRVSLPLVGSVLGIGGLFVFLSRYGRHGRHGRHGRRRPTAAQLMRLDDADFADFIRGTGLGTLSTIDPNRSGGSPD